LLEHKEYYEITITDIVDTADIGKTTFYRHYDRKLDIFVEMHNQIFDGMFQELVNRDDWLNTKATSKLTAIAKKAVGKTGGRSSIAYKLGNDWPNAQRLLNECLTDKINKNLNVAFKGYSWTIDIDYVANAIASLYMDFLIQLNNTPDKQSAIIRANNLQRFCQAIILESLNEPFVKKER